MSYKDYMYTPDCPYCRFFRNIDGACEDCQHRKTYPDLVAVIRCRECKHWLNNHLCKKWSVYGSIETLADGFCYVGEREDNDS